MCAPAHGIYAMSASPNSVAHDLPDSAGYRCPVCGRTSPDGAANRCLDKFRLGRYMIRFGLVLDASWVSPGEGKELAVWTCRFGVARGGYALTSSRLHTDSWCPVSSLGGGYRAGFTLSRFYTPS